MNKDEIKEIEENSPPPIFNPAPPKESKKSKAINKVIALALLIIAIGLGILFYWGVADENVVTLNKNPFPTRTIREHPTAGGVVFLTTDFCKKTDVVGERRLSYVSETREVFLPIEKADAPKGCTVRELAVLIPNDITPDTYRIKMRVTYNLNPLKREVTQIFYSYPVIIDPVTEGNKLPIDTKIDSSMQGTTKQDI